MGQLRSKFAKLNANGDKYLSFEELSKLLKKGNPNMSYSELQMLFDGVDKNHDGKIDFDEFVDFIFSKTGETRVKREMKGPEHFYDKSTYTGVHTQGGPA